MPDTQITYHNTTEQVLLEVRTTKLSDQLLLDESAKALQRKLHLSRTLKDKGS